MKYLIWSTEHRAWWRPKSIGYTPHRVEAGEFDLNEANNICTHADIGNKNPDIPKELMIPSENESWNKPKKE